MKQILFENNAEEKDKECTILGDQSNPAQQDVSALLGWLISYAISYAISHSFFSFLNLCEQADCVYKNCTAVYSVFPPTKNANGTYTNLFLCILTIGKIPISTILESTLWTRCINPNSSGI